MENSNVLDYARMVRSGKFEQLKRVQQQLKRQELHATQRAKLGLSKDHLKIAKGIHGVGYSEN